MKTCLPSTGKKQFPFFKGLVITALLVLFSSISAWATHYRYGNIQWTDNGGNKVTFKIQQAWRWSYFGNPVLGSTVNIAAADGAVPFEFGDGQSVDIQIKVTSINASEDWFFGEVTYVHTYASPGNYTASFEGSARISTLKNNADGSFRLHTLVNVGNGAHSTVSTVVPIVDLPVNDASASFTIPVVDPDGHTVSFRLATASEAAGTGNPYVQPTGLSVNASSGIVTFSTVGKTVGDLYTSQIVISNGVTEIAVDFIIRIVPNPPPSTPPYFVYPPTPDNGHTFNVNVGSLLSFNVTAKDDDPGSSVTLTVVGMPPGATTTPALPTNGQPVTTQFNWTPTISNVGSYILVFTATDNTGISVTTQVNIKVSAVCDPNFSSSIAVVPSPTIPGGDPNTIYIGNGPQSVTLTASATGGNGGNTYDWGSAGTGASIIVSPSITTTYTVTVTDAGGCTTQSSVIIYVVNIPTLSCSVQKVSDVKCKGESNGSATVTPTGGIGGYTYLWDDNETTATATMLNAGSHSVTVTDSKSNTSNCNVTISEPDLALSCSVQKALDVKCKGESNGSATVTPAGGNGGYTYLWDDNETTATATMLNAGSHSVTVTDSKGCTSNCNVTISEPDLALSCSVQKALDVKCKGESNGSATVTPAGGNGGYTYLWDDNETTATATMLNAESHSVTVTDSKGCTSNCNVTISEPDLALSCSVQKALDVKCKGESNGSATVTPAGGNGGYTYLWDDNETTATATMLNAGSHSVTVTDSKGCTSNCNVTISEPDLALSCSVQKALDVKCKGESNGSATVTPAGGNGGYTYLWDDNETTATATMLNAESHSVTVTDSKGCTSNCNVTISEPDLALSCSVQKALDVKCKGESNGSATVTPAGGNGGYTYLWDDNETTTTATMLNAGSHSVTVTDSKGCTSNCNVTISEPDLALSCSVQKALDVKCKGGSNGSATVTPAGGNGGYTYLWDDNETTTTATMLNAGSHSVTVTDSKGCTSNCNVTISEPDLALSCSVQKVADVKCNGQSNGSATVTPAGGNGGYTYLWDDNETTTTATMLNAGSHSVTVTDSKGCTSSCDVSIDEPQPLVCSIAKPTTLTCNSTGNQLCATVSGGTGAIMYKWKSNNTAWVITSGKGTNCITYTAGSSSASDVKFTLTITDAHGCKSTCTIKLSCGCSFVTNGVATKTNKQCYQLTGTAFHSAGSVFSNAPVNLKKSFQINASLYFGVNDDGGDGIAFVLQNEGPHYIGNYGAGIGYHRFDGIGCGPIDNPGQVPSFIVEFDTYENHNIVYCKDIGDPPGDHIGFMSHSDAFHTSQHALSAPQEFGANIEDGKYHDVQFDWNASTKTMTVTFTVTNTPLVKKTYVYTGDIVKKLFSGNSMVYFGFTGSNGSFSPNEHRVCINTPCAPQYITQQSSFVQGSTNTANSSELLAQKNTVSVFPNPFSSELIFKFKSPANGHATLELFDMVGKRLAVVYDGEVKFQALYNFNYKVPAEYRVPMMYKITIGEEIYHGFLMPTR